MKEKLEVKEREAYSSRPGMIQQIEKKFQGKSR